MVLSSFQMSKRNCGSKALFSPAGVPEQGEAGAVAPLPLKRGQGGNKDARFVKHFLEKN